MPRAIEVPDGGLDDGVIRLRALRRGDFPALIAAVDDPEIARYTTVPSPYGDREARAWLRQIETGLRAGTEAALIIVAADDDSELLGACGIRQRPGDAGNWNVGYWVAAAARGNGVATRALRLICEWGFSTLGAERIELLAEEENPASRAVAAGCGFRREGVLRSYLPIAGSRRDLVIHSLLPGDPLSGPVADRLRRRQNPEFEGAGG